MSPKTVKDVQPLGIAFVRESEAAAASKLKIPRPVPHVDETVTVTELERSQSAFDWHVSIVAALHDDVKHTPRLPEPPFSSSTVAV